jgi:hypothetical protein
VKYITLRDHIAVEAMKALIMEPEWDGAHGETLGSNIAKEAGVDPDNQTFVGNVSASAYALADAMLAARERVA